MILLDAIYINNGGGKILLDYLIKNLEETNQEVYYLLDKRVKGNIIVVKQSNVIQYLDPVFNLRNNFYKQNKENIKFINEFAFQYKKENDYMDIVVEIDLGNNEMQVLLFKNMYAEKFYQSFSTNKGSSTFVLDLKQKYYENAKVEIH